MKHTSSLFVAAAIAAIAALGGCIRSPKPKAYHISGTVVGAADGDTVSLIEGRQSELEILQNAVVRNGHFSFSGVQDSTVLLYISYVSNDDPERSAMASLFLENAAIQVTMDPDSDVADVRGTKANETWTAFARENARRSAEGMEAYFASIDTTATEAARKGAQQRLIAIEDSITVFYKDFIASNIDNVVGQHVLSNYADQLNDDDFVLQQLERITDEKAIPAVRYLRRFKTIQAETAVGQPYQDVMAETPNGNILAASNLLPRCRLLMIDFWASWCGPCRSEIPNVAEVYKKYHAQGFEVLGVSLDNDLDPWVSAIEEMHMTWPQISDLEGWNSFAAQTYAIRAIPATVLIQDGKIVARDVRGQRLEPTVRKFLGLE